MLHMSRLSLIDRTKELLALPLEFQTKSALSEPVSKMVILLLLYTD